MGQLGRYQGQLLRSKRRALLQRTMCSVLGFWFHTQRLTILRKQSVRAMDIAFLALLLSTLTVGVACSDQIRTSYSTRAEAEQSGAIARGWVPGIVPGGSTDIQETHNVDTSQTWGKFSFAASSTETLRSALNEIEAPSLAGHEVRSPNTEWWPPVLTGRLKEQELRASRFKFYKVQQNGPLFFAVDWEKKEAFFWR